MVSFIVKNMDNRYNAKPEVQSVSSLLHDLTDKDGNIDLDPPYQRNVVWDDDKKQNFIDSVMKNWNPHPIIFNILPDGKKICIDGKQRLTSLKMFYKNKIYWKCDDEKYYYNDNEKHKDSSKLTAPLLNDFRNSKIIIVEYENLSYAEQLELFNRIQNGISASPGELHIGSFSTKKSCEKFKEYCNDLGDCVKKFTNNNRGEHYQLFLRLSFLIHNGMKSYDTKKINKFINDTLDDLTQCIKLSKQLDEIIKHVFTDEIFNHDDIKSSMKGNIMVVILYFLHKEYENNYEKIEDDCEKIRYAIVKTCKDSEFIKNIKSSTTEDTLKKIKEKYRKCYKSYDELDSESESDKKPKKKNIKHLAIKKNIKK